MASAADAAAMFGLLLLWLMLLQRLTMALYIPCRGDTVELAEPPSASGTPAAAAAAAAAAANADLLPTAAVADFGRANIILLPPDATAGGVGDGMVLRGLPPWVAPAAAAPAVAPAPVGMLEPLPAWKPEAKRLFSCCSSADAA